MFQLLITSCPVEQVETLQAVLTLCGALSVTLTDPADNPIFEPDLGTIPLWPSVKLTALFETQETAQQSAQALLSVESSLHYDINELEAADWERVCLKDIKPLQYGQRLWVCPSWLTPPQPDAVNVMLDPGLAFGTGTHPTTTLCLRWLEKTAMRDLRVIDYGCGSGILALAALKLGAHPVYAVDIDPQALQATYNNALLNGFTAEKMIIASPESLTEPVDVLLANILLNPLLSLIPRFHDLLKPQGRLVVSGIQTHQVDTLVAAYADHFSCVTVEQEEEWALVEMTR